MGECPVCKGEGTIPAVPDPMECPNCEGEGDDDTVEDEPDFPDTEPAGKASVDDQFNGPYGAAVRLVDMLEPVTGEDLDAHAIADALGDASHVEPTVQVDRRMDGNNMATVTLDLDYVATTFEGDHERDLKPDTDALSEAMGQLAFVTSTEVWTTPDGVIHHKVQVDYVIPAEYAGVPVFEPTKTPSMDAGHVVGRVPDTAGGGPTVNRDDPVWVSNDSTIVEVETTEGERVTTTTSALEADGVTIDSEGRVSGLPNGAGLDA